MTLRSALLDENRFVFLYGTTPPSATATEERIHRAASRLTERIQNLDLDGFIVYDVQEEGSRTAEPRPFPYLPTIDSRIYAHLLETMTGKSAIAYKCVAQTPPMDWNTWLQETVEVYGLRYLSLVGRASSGESTLGISLPKATEVAVQHPQGFTIGGVVIPERHSPARSESERLIQKTKSGCRFFTSQAVYDPAATIALCRDYAHDCENQGLRPQRILLTFTPCGRPETLRFLHWLGVSIPKRVEEAMLTAPSPLTASLDICIQNLRLILESGAVRDIPLGINVESVSIRKEEIEASVELCSRLRQLTDEYQK
jgi:5,10-methylenetetrahydrofolate reductase